MEPNEQSEIKGNRRVIDIAMLGAHDAFTAGMLASSPANRQELPAVLATLLRPFRRAVRRISRAQCASAYELARRGVRYFDVRVTWDGQNFFATHGLLTGELEGYIRGLLQFLSETEGELLVVDIQHTYLKGSGMPELFAWLDAVRVEGKSLLDYVRFDPAEVPLEALSYRQATRGGSGVVLLAEWESDKADRRHYIREDSIRSEWHNTTRFGKLFACIRAEYARLCADRNAVDWQRFRVNQAVVTPSLTSLRRFAKATLLGEGRRLNAELIRQADFAQWLEALPIVMVDCADSDEGGFNEEVLRVIAAHNARESFAANQ